MTDTDHALIEQLKHHDQQALSTLYDRYALALYSLAFRILEQREPAEEIVQDVFLYLWRRPDAYKPERGKLLTWLLIVTRYRAIDRLRREHTKMRIDETPLEELSDDAAAVYLQDNPIYQDGQLLRELITRLPREQAQAINLAFFQGLTHSGIAAMTGLPLGTIKTRLRTALHTLRGLWLREAEQPQEAEQSKL